MGEPARAAVLVALADGQALAASTLAAEAGVAPSTLSGHLARLAPTRSVRSLRAGTHAQAIRAAGTPSRGGGRLCGAAALRSALTAPRWVRSAQAGARTALSVPERTDLT